MPLTLGGGYAETRFSSACWVLVSSLLLPAASHNQSMQDVLNELFVFGGGEDALFLAGSAGSPGTAALHGDHFIPASSDANTALLSFFNTAIAANISNFPLSSTVAGVVGAAPRYGTRGVNSY